MGLWRVINYLTSKEAEAEAEEVAGCATGNNNGDALHNTGTPDPHRTWLA